MNNLGRMSILRKAAFIALILLLQITLCVSCVPAKKNPPENIEPSPVYKTENITLNGSTWIYLHSDMESTGRDLRNAPKLQKPKLQSKKSGSQVAKSTLKLLRHTLCSGLILTSRRKSAWILASPTKAR